MHGQSGGCESSCSTKSESGCHTRAASDVWHVGKHSETSLPDTPNALNLPTTTNAAVMFAAVAAVAAVSAFAMAAAVVPVSDSVIMDV